MAKTLPIIVTNDSILVKDMDSDEFKVFHAPGVINGDTIPFYHQFAKKIGETQYYFKEFVKGIYGKKCGKLILAIIVPDDTSALESIFINEFFLNSGVCKAVAQMNMGQALSKEDDRYISVSKTSRNVVIQYINNNEVVASKLYPANAYDVDAISEDIKRLHIDVEYADLPIYVNNLNVNMDDFVKLGKVVTTREFLDKIAVVDVEKI